MSNPIEFYFDFSSPYGYLASERIDAVAARHGRDVAWRPWLMGVANEGHGIRPAHAPADDQRLLPARHGA